MLEIIMVKMIWMICYYMVLHDGSLMYDLSLKCLVTRYGIMLPKYMYNGLNVAFVYMCEPSWFFCMDWSPLYRIYPRCEGSMFILVRWWCEFDLPRSYLTVNIERKERDLMDKSTLLFPLMLYDLGFYCIA